MTVQSRSTDRVPLECERQVLFENRGDTVPRIPSLVATVRGTLIATAQWRKGSRSDHGRESDIVMRRSTDGGRSWQPMRTLASEPGCDFHNGPMVVDRERGRIVTFFRRWPDSIPDNAAFHREMIARRDHWRAWGVATYLSISDDDGVTWTQPRALWLEHPDSIGFVSVGNGVHGVQLADGRLAVQASFPTATRARSLLLVSGDGGRTWDLGPEWESGYGCQEFALAAYDDRVLVNQRTKGEAPVRRGRWLDLARDPADVGTFRDQGDLIEPVCHASLLRIRTPAGERLAFANPGRPSGTGTWDRESRWELGIRISADRGETWSAPRLVEPGRSAYSDLAQAPDGNVVCIYEAGVDDYNDEIRCARITADQLA